MQLALATIAPQWRAYVELTKPRVVSLMMFTVLVGMLLSVGGLMAVEMIAVPGAKGRGGRPEKPPRKIEKPLSGRR